MRTSIIVAPLLMLVITPVSVISQPPKTTEPGRDLESDAVSLLPTSIKQTTLELTIDGRTISVPVQYAVRGTDTKDRPTLFVLPVWIAVEVERVIEGPKDRQRTRLSPSDPLVPPGETRPVQLNVTVRNLLDNPATEKLIVNHLKQYVAEQLGLDQPAFRYEKPHINEAAVRFTLIGRGRGNEPEIVLSNAVPSADGLLGFDLDIAAIRRCEQLHALSGGLAVGNVTIMASGPIKVRFERLEMEAQVRYLRSALADLRKRVGSAVNPAGPPPDVIIPLTAGSTAEVQNHIAAMLQQSLRVTVSTRQGSTDLPLLRFLEKATDNLLRLSEIDTTHDQQRLTFLLDNQVSITATLGELKRLSRLDEKGRAEAFRQAYDHFTASRRDESSSRSNTVGVGFAFWSARYSDSYSQHQSQTDVARHQQEEQQLRQAFDRVMQLFEGNVKFPTGLHLDDRVLSSSLKDVQTEFTQRSFFYDFTLHRFAPIR
ncbi:MAG: hypothetical protein NZU63_12860 [Gemmataceae bacterium]|nr:hypothetical protein [Gemmataceae bacterium]MDW8244181.1 hypothetical protein [Thermogemmata sp.]